MYSNNSVIGEAKEKKQKRLLFLTPDSHLLNAYESH